MKDRSFTVRSIYDMVEDKTNVSEDEIKRIGEKISKDSMYPERLAPIFRYVMLLH